MGLSYGVVLFLLGGIEMGGNRYGVFENQNRD